MDWRSYITADPAVLGGKPVLRGTRLSVELLFGLLAAGWSVEQLLDSYPNLTLEHLHAMFAYAQESAAHDQGLLHVA